MTDIVKESENRIETLAMSKVLEGLIHNINTPLNIIIGYSQQLKKQHPELTNLDKINTAGLQIDDVIHACSRQITQRLQNTMIDFDLKQWFLDEIKLLNNILDIKHKVLFETKLTEDELIVNSNPFILGLFMESLMLHLVKSVTPTQNDNRISFSVLRAKNGAELNIHLPQCCTDVKIDAYLASLQAELQKTYNVNSKTDFPFAWAYNHKLEIKITLSLKGSV